MTRCHRAPAGHAPTPTDCGPPGVARFHPAGGPWRWSPVRAGPRTLGRNDEFWNISGWFWPPYNTIIFDICDICLIKIFIFDMLEHLKHFCEMGPHLEVEMPIIMVKGSECEQKWEVHQQAWAQMVKPGSTVPRLSMVHTFSFRNLLTIFVGSVAVTWTTLGVGKSFCLMYHEVDQGALSHGPIFPNVKQIFALISDFKGFILSFFHRWQQPIPNQRSNLRHYHPTSEWQIEELRNHQLIHCRCISSL